MNTRMKPTDLIRAIFYPVTSMAVVVPLLVFWLAVSFAAWGGVLGLFLMFLIIPALLRFQMIVLEARARGVEPTTPTSISSAGLVTRGHCFRWFCVH